MHKVAIYLYQSSFAPLESEQLMAFTSTEVANQYSDRAFLKLKAKVAKWKHRAAKLTDRVRILEGED